jgi:uncharacterized protein YecE (DUF72 family)
MGLRIGTSGWSYPTGKGKWNGLFYPATRSRRAGTADFDELRFYAEHFNTVEVNSTFYGQPKPEVARTWVTRTPPGFEFSLKLYQKFTHPKMFRETALTRAPGSEGPLLDVLSQVTQSDIDEFREGLEPLVDAGRLGALLAQFPASFKNDRQSQDYLASLLRAFGDYRLPSSSVTRAGATLSATHWRCSTGSAPRGSRSTSRSSDSRFGRTICRT